MSIRHTHTHAYTIYLVRISAFVVLSRIRLFPQFCLRVYFIFLFVFFFLLFRSFIPVLFSKSIIFHSHMLKQTITFQKCYRNSFAHLELFFCARVIQSTTWLLWIVHWFLLFLSSRRKNNKKLDERRSPKTINHFSNNDDFWKKEWTAALLFIVYTSSLRGHADSGMLFIIGWSVWFSWWFRLHIVLLFHPSPPPTLTLSIERTVRLIYINPKIILFSIMIHRWSCVANINE